jgi:transcriptional regulator with XRE-family HTH domain
VVYLKAVGSRLRDLRLNNNLSIKEVAAKLEVTGPTITQYESGKRKVPFDMLREFAKLYKTSSDYILGLSSEGDLKPLLKEKVLTYNGIYLTEEESRILREMAEIMAKSHEVKDQNKAKEKEA